MRTPGDLSFFSTKGPLIEMAFQIRKDWRKMATYKHTKKYIFAGEITIRYCRVKNSSQAQSDCGILLHVSVYDARIELSLHSNLFELCSKFSIILLCFSTSYMSFPI